MKIPKQADHKDVKRGREDRGESGVGKKKPARERKTREPTETIERMRNREESMKQQAPDIACNSSSNR